jgi:hypothetical protein
MKRVVFTFGRLNPPTIGHQKLVDKVNSSARKMKAESRVYLSHTQNTKKDPLDYDEKLRLSKKAFGSSITKSSARTPIDIMKELEADGFTDAILVVGSDRVSGFSFIKKYNGIEYNFESVKIISAGQRDPDAEGVSGMSASKMRAAAKDGDFEAFKSGLPKALYPESRKIFDQLRGIIEMIDMNEENNVDDIDEVMDAQQRKARGRIMKKNAKKIQRSKEKNQKKMASTETLKDRAQDAAKNALRKKVAGARGKSYGSLKTSAKIAIDKLVDKKKGSIAKIAKKMLPTIRKKEVSRLAAYRDNKESYSLKSFKTFMKENK